MFAVVIALTSLWAAQAAAAAAPTPTTEMPADAATRAPDPASDPATATGWDSSPADPNAASLPPPPPPLPMPRRYGDQGTSEIAVGLGYSNYAGFLAAGGFRYFVVDGVAPGVEATYISGGSQFSALGLVLGALRVVPVRTSNVALVLTGRAGRVLLEDHRDGWGAGGGGGVIIFFGGSAGLELGYEALRLLPASFCADLRSCVIHGPVFGLRLTL